MGNAKRIIIFLWLFMPFFAAAQTMSTARQRHVNMKLLNLIEQYELTATLYDDGAKYAFMQLFSNEKVPVYSDMLDYHQGRQIEVADYVNRLSSMENVSMHIMNVSHTNYVLEDGKWTTTVTFDKSLVYNDSNGVLFSSPEYYKANYSMSMKCVYDSEADRCYIAGINGRMNSSQPNLPEHFIVVDLPGSKVDKLGLEGNSFDQAFAPGLFLTPWNDDIHLKSDVIAHTDNYDYVTMSFRATHLRAKLRFAYALGSVFKVSTPVALDHIQSTGFEAGAEFGYNIPLGRTTSLGIYLGAAYSSSKINFGLDNVKYSYRTMDAAGKAYNRHYEFDSITEGVSYTDLALPIYLSFDQRIVKNLYVSLNAGAKIYLNGNVKVQPYNMNGRVYGDYNGTIVTSQASDAITNISGDYNTFLYPNSYNREAIDFSVLGGLSLSYNIFKNSAYIYLKYSYELGMSDVHKSEENRLFDAAEGQYPMVYSAHLNQNVATRSFMDCVSYKRQAMWIELGLTFKF